MGLFHGKRRWWGIGLGAGLAGAAAVALRHALAGAGRARIPDSISPAIFATRVARTACGQMLYHESGSGEPLIFLHGGHVGGSSYEWSKVYPSFAAGAHVLAPDLIGFGESERPAEPLGPFEHVRALAEFIGYACSNRPCAVVGSHYGGALAVLLASQHPDLVRRLVLFAPTGFAERDRLAPLSAVAVAARVPVLRGIVHSRRATRRGVRRWLAQEGFRGTEAACEELVEVFSNCARQYRAEAAGVAILARAPLAFDFESRFSALPFPVSVLWPAQSPSAPLQRACRLLGSAPQGSTLDVLPECGLLAPLEAPETVTRAVRSALDLSIRAVS